MDDRKNTVVAGIGNPLMGDEGVGIHALRELMAVPFRAADVDFVEVGTSSMSLVHAIADRKKAVLIDCARMGESPGTIRRFGPDEVISAKDTGHLSFHEGDVLSAIELSRTLGECPGEIVIFGIEPQTVEPLMELSETLRDRLHEYVRTVADEMGTVFLQETNTNSVKGR